MMSICSLFRLFVVTVFKLHGFKFIVCVLVHVINEMYVINTTCIK